VSIDLVLGPRPDEPGPPIAGPRNYPVGVEARLAQDAAVIIGKYPQARSALLPLLHLVQAEDGYLTAAGIGFCARQLGLTDAEVAAVATFYSMYRRTPTGRYLVGVCTNTLCAIMGGDAILESLEHHLGIQPGQTTGDGQITLEHLECNAACDYAPVIMVNWEFFDNQTPCTARELVDALQTGQPIAASRGGTIGTFAETARTLAGLPQPGRPADGGGAAEATLAGLRVAQALDMTAPTAERPADTTGTGHPGSAAEATESTRDQPAPAPSATVPPEPGTPETDPAATESGD
jgi:NADH-quinone oxidoreductase subunit E